MSNFAFLPPDFRSIAESAALAEGHILGDPRAACFHARFALETLVHWIYRHDAALRLPYDPSLGALLHDPGFQNLLPQAVFQKTRVIQKVGNQAVHTPRPIQQNEALQVVRELHHICHWLVRTYSPETSREGANWLDARVPQALGSGAMVPRKDLEALEKKLAEQHPAAFKAQQQRDELDAELQMLRQKVAEIRETSTARPDLHDYSEAQTRYHLIDVDLRRAGWSLDGPKDKEYEVRGMPTAKGLGYADYVLWGDDGKPLGVVEAKKSTADPQVGQQQSKLYADCLEQMHGQRPIIFFTNGYKSWIWDDTSYPPRQVAGFYKKDELHRLIVRRAQRQPLDVAEIKDAIVERFYQKRAIGSIATQFTQSRRKALLVMATGTGKTRTAIALVDLLQRAGWVKRALFLADRVSLVNQACNAFKAHLPESSPVNLVIEKSVDGRTYVCTYPTMMGMINDTQSEAAKFGVGHFDLVIVDEAHRSVYKKYGAIFRYFDSLLVGLTATPREEIDKNTYDLFDLETGVPTDAYELTDAVNDGFLVPPRVQQIDLKFPREGIVYDQLTDDEKAQWEGLDWGDDSEPNPIPEKVNAAAVNNWLFNKDTVDKVLQHLMEHGHKVDAGDRLAKTIIFARNHEHAMFIEERFNHHYPQYAGHFARVIDNQAKYPQNLIDDFSVATKSPHIAISVDMLDTGIDVPQVANLVFFKPVYSKTKFWQMLGRGTRLCPDLFGPNDPKLDFRVFDFCANFDFFQENPKGIEANDSTPLGTRLFRARVQLLGHVQIEPKLDPDLAIRTALADNLHSEVAGMNRDNFIVRMHLEPLDRFRDRKAWDNLSDSDRLTLNTELAGLQTEIGSDHLESRLFDLTALRMQLAKAEADQGAFERYRKRVVEIAMLLEDKNAIPAVAAQLAYLAGLQDPSFWQDISLAMLEDMRRRLRGLVPFLDKKHRNTVYTDFKDELIGVRETTAIEIPKMTGVQYAKKVEDYLRNHLNNIVIHRLRTNQPLSADDLKSLEQTLVQIGEDNGATLLSDLLARSATPSLAHFVRSMVGMDRSTAQAAFSQFLSDQSLTATQIRFVQLVIDQLTSRGVMDASALYEPPFTNLHFGGPDELFAGKQQVINAVFSILKSFEPQVHTLAG